MSEDAKFRVPTQRGLSSVVALTEAWYVACTSAELRGAPLGRRVAGRPLVLFRGGEGQPVALLDRCPHRNVPLSLGRRRAGELECAYHGWRFGSDGACRHVPGLDGNPPRARVEAFATQERDGYVWVWPGGPTGRGEPHRFPLVDKPGYATIREVLDEPGSIHAVAENALDVPHTPYLHAGLFRRPAKKPGQKRRVAVEVRRWHDRVEAEYIGEARPTGLAGRILAPGGGDVQHIDRFRLPGITEVEYRIGERHVLISAALTPVEDHLTRLYVVFSYRLPIPPALMRAIARPVLLQIYRQDATILQAQVDNMNAFGGEHYTSTELDVLGPHILQLLRRAAKGQVEPVAEPATQSLTMEM